jgi:hypothetical protein
VEDVIRLEDAMVSELELLAMEDEDSLEDERKVDWQLATINKAIIAKLTFIFICISLLCIK